MTKNDIADIPIGKAIRVVGRTLLTALMATAGALGAYVAIHKWAKEQYTSFQNDLADRIVSETATSVLTQLGRLPPPVVEIRGIGVVAEKPPFYPGQSVTIFYVLRRNNDCETDIDILFIDTAGRVQPDMRSRIPSVRAPVTNGFELFGVPIRIPDNTRPGRYSYAPDITPAQASCLGFPSDQVPLSEFFDVIARPTDP